MSNPRSSYSIRKNRELNNIDQTYNTSDLKDMIIKPIKIEKVNINIQNLVKTKELDSSKDLEESIKKRTNMPYKGIIKNFDYNKQIKNSNDLVVHKVTNDDKDSIVFENTVNKYTCTITEQNKEIKDVYSVDKKNEHLKQFEYQHKYKYASKLDDNESADLRTDRVDFYKKEQHKMEDNKKKVDDILTNLIDSGALSENLDTINYDKIDAKELEEKLKQEFGEKEFERMFNEIKNQQ